MPSACCNLWQHLTTNGYWTNCNTGIEEAFSTSIGGGLWGKGLELRFPLPACSSLAFLHDVRKCPKIAQKLQVGFDNFMQNPSKPSKSLEFFFDSNTTILNPTFLQWVNPKIRTATYLKTPSQAAMSYLHLEPRSRNSVHAAATLASSWCDHMKRFHAKGLHVTIANEEIRISA